MIWTLDDYLQQLPEDQRKRVEARAKVIESEELTLSQLRKAMQHSQATLAAQLGVKQAEVCRLEGRTDMYLSTLRRYVEAMGGQLELRASFPSGSAILIKDFSSLGPFDDITDSEEAIVLAKSKEVVEASPVIKPVAASKAIKPVAASKAIKPVAASKAIKPTAAAARLSTAKKKPKV